MTEGQRFAEAISVGLDQMLMGMSIAGAVVFCLALLVTAIMLGPARK